MVLFSVIMLIDFAFSSDMSCMQVSAGKICYSLLIIFVLINSDNKRSVANDYEIFV